MVQTLRDRGIRLTAERRSILAGVLTCGGHFDVVYRSLSTLVEVGLLRKIDMGDRQSLYEPIEGREHHEHMICVRCGEILEFVEPEIERLQQEVCHRNGFEPLDHTLQIYGVCRACNCKDIAIGSKGLTRAGAGG
jgi:Fe2+ or Zn2+ uptake regulation protein